MLTDKPTQSILVYTYISTSVLVFIYLKSSPHGVVQMIRTSTAADDSLAYGVSTIQRPFYDLSRPPSERVFILLSWESFLTCDGWGY